MNENLPLKVIGDSGEFHKPLPLGTREDWKLAVWVQGKFVKEYTLAELLRLEPEPHGEATEIRCVSSGGIVRKHGNKTVTFGGVRISRLYDDLHLRSELGPIGELSPTVQFVSAAPGGCGPKTKNHRTALPLHDCLNPSYGVMLATSIDDTPMPYGNGGPLRSVVSDTLFFYKAVKWLREIRFCRGPLHKFRGTWEDYAGYHNRGRTGPDERFEPRMREIQEVRLDMDDRPYDVTKLIPKKAWREVWENMLGHREQPNLSRLIVSRLDEMNLEIPRDFRNVVFSDGDFKAKIRGTLFKECMFAGTNLEGCNFSLSKFPQTRFSETDGAQPANLQKCDFEGANFQSSWLQGVSMEGATLTNTKFTSEHFREKTDRVRGLIVKNAVNLDDSMKEWLDRNGAVV